jgi:hypothetical protein
MCETVVPWISDSEPETENPNDTDIPAIVVTTATVDTDATNTIAACCSQVEDEGANGGDKSYTKRYDFENKAHELYFSSRI